MVCVYSFLGGIVFGDLVFYEVFFIGGINSVWGYDEGVVGLGCLCIVVSGEVFILFVCFFFLFEIGGLFFLYEVVNDVFIWWNEINEFFER